MELDVSTSTSLFHKAVVTIHKTKQGMRMTGAKFQFKI